MKRRKVSLEKLQSDFAFWKHNCGYWIKKTTPGITTEEIEDELLRIALNYMYNPGKGKLNVEEKAIAMSLSMLYDMQETEIDKLRMYDITPKEYKKICEEKGIDTEMLYEKAFLMMACEAYQAKIEELRKENALKCINANKEYERRFLFWKNECKKAMQKLNPKLTKEKAEEEFGKMLESLMSSEENTSKVTKQFHCLADIHLHNVIGIEKLRKIDRNDVEVLRKACEKEGISVKKTAKDAFYYVAAGVLKDECKRLEEEYEKTEPCAG